MKNIYLFAILFMLIFNANYAQKKIEIDVTDNILKKSIIVSPDKYKIIMKNAESDKHYEVVITKENIVYDPLPLPEDFGSLGVTGKKSLIDKTIETIDIGSEEKVTIQIDVYKTVKDSFSKEKSYLYELETARRGRWQTTFGFNFIYLIKNNTYFSKAVDSTFTITEGTNKKKYDFHPTIMFTWFPTNPECRNGDFNFGLSGGLGYDLEKSLSIFTGISFVYNQNLTFTAGLAFHNQERLLSSYKEGDIIKEQLTFEQLHDDYIRVNPFVSLSFRLDKAPFKK